MILGTGANEVRRGALVAFLLLLCLCVNSWAACNSTSNNYSIGDSYCHRRPNCGTSWCGNIPCGSGGAVTIPGNENVVCLSSSWVSGGGNPACNFGNSNPAQTCYNSDNIHIYNTGSNCYVCGTPAEADSVACANNPDAEGCGNACTEYKNDCEWAGGIFQGQVVDDKCVSSCDICNTQEAQDNKSFWFDACCSGGLTPQWSCQNNFSTDGMYISQIYGGCNTANWETQKTCDSYYSSSAEAQQSSSSNAAQSSSSVSEYCQLFPTDLACICASNPEHPDCAYLNSSGSEGGDGSSGSEGGDGSSGSEGGDGSSGSGGGGEGSGGGGEGSGGSGDWEYDYRDSLHRIINATTRTATNTQTVAENTGIITSILQQAKCLFTDCTNYEALKEALDSNITIPGGDTAGILDSMAGMTNLDSLRGVLDGMDWASYGDSLDGALEGLGDGVDGLFADSGLYGPMGDYRDMIEDKFPTAQWSYTSSCPAALNSNISFTFPAPIGTISSGKNLGGYFCGPLPPFNITLGNMIRAVIRLALTIAMAIGIFKAATGFNNE